MSDAVESIARLGTATLLDGISRNCFMVSVTVRRWAGNYLIKGANISVNRGSVLDESLAAPPRWKLMPDHWHKQIQPFVSKVRSVLAKYTSPLKDGVQIVPHSSAQSMMTELRDIKTAYRSIAEKFIDEWPDILNALEKKVTQEAGRGQWAQLEEKIPKASKLSSMFDIEISYWPAGGSGASTQIPKIILDSVDRLRDFIGPAQGGLRALEGNDTISHHIAPLLLEVENLIRASRRATKKITDANLEEWMREASQTTDRLVAEAVEGMLTTPLQEFADAVDNLTRLHDKGAGTCREASIESIRRAYNKLMSFQFMVPGDLIERLKTVETDLTAITPRDVNTKATIAANLSAALRSISEELNSEDTRTKGLLTNFSRYVELD